MTRRFVFLSLPFLPTDRLIRKTGSLQADQPLALAATVDNARRLTALNASAYGLGVRRGMMVTDARALEPGLNVLPHEQDQDCALLEALGHWALRFTPMVMRHGAEGLMLDVSGCAHLFGGEGAMLSIIRNRFADLGFSAVYVAMADTMLAAWALAIYGKQDETLVPSGAAAHKQVLDPLPVAALRLPAKARDGLQALGLKRIADLSRTSRAALAKRFGMDVMGQYDKALGHAADAFDPLVAPPQHRARTGFAEPIQHREQIEQVIDVLVPDLAGSLAKAGQGARLVVLRLFRVDGRVYSLRAGLAAPIAQADHLARLLRDRLDQDEANVDAGFGFDCAMLEAVETAAVQAEQLSHYGDKTKADDPFDPAIDLLVDRLAVRLGSGAITLPRPRASHWPERTEQSVSVQRHNRRTLTKQDAPQWQQHRALLGPRPASLFNPPQAIEVMAEVPDGPPLQFRWRKQGFRVTAAQGPERIAPEWWLIPNAQRKAGNQAVRRFKSRDYYRVETQSGHRFWLFRRGLYGDDLLKLDDDAAPRWYLHGLFA